MLLVAGVKGVGETAYKIREIIGQSNNIQCGAVQQKGGYLL